MWTEAGSGHVEQGGWSGTAGPGDLVVLGSRVAQHYRVAPGADGWRFWWIHFQPRPMWLTWLTPFTRGTRCYVMRELAPAVRARVGAVFLRAHADARWSGHGAPPQPDPLAAAHPAIAEAPVARELVLGAVEEVLVLASAAAPAAEESADPRVRQAQAFIAAEPGAPHTVETLAKAVALSPSRFAHLFAAQTGRTPMRAVREARLRYAAQAARGDRPGHRAGGRCGGIRQPLPLQPHLQPALRARSQGVQGPASATLNSSAGRPSRR